MKTSGLAFSALTLAVFAFAPAKAQQVEGVPGSPSATTTIDGNYLPPPPPKFGGQIGLDAAQSKPYWPPAVVPPKGAPNVLLIMTDDAGYGVSGTARPNIEVSQPSPLTSCSISSPTISCAYPGSLPPEVQSVCNT
jgi:hypothetical protein